MEDQILKRIRQLIALHSAGMLGGKTMPEDVRPALSRRSGALAHYLTLGMCLNYQRNSYHLWEGCTKTYGDNATKWVFDPIKTAEKSITELREALLTYKVALQPNKHVENWRRVSAGICRHGEGDIRNILAQKDFDIELVRNFVQINKKDFPYLAGPKICNYWLNVLTQYTDFPLTNKRALSVAPDTHVIQASVKLNLISAAEQHQNNVATLVAQRWQDVLQGTDLVPIDVHTPLWLWSRGGFQSLGA